MINTNLGGMAMRYYYPTKEDFYLKKLFFLNSNNIVTRVRFYTFV